MGFLMKNVFEKTYSITTNMLDKNDYLKPSSIVDLAQHAAGLHADLLKIGFNDFVGKGYYWVIVRNYFEILKYIKNPNEVKVVTYPLKSRFVEIPRDVEIFCNGELIVKLRMIWMILDYVNKSIVGTDIVKDIYSDKPELFNERIRKLVVTNKEKLSFIKKQTVTYSMLDHNGHMNNTRYLDLFIDVFKEYDSKSITSIQIEYIRQCYLGEELSLYSYKEDTNCYLYGYSNNELRFYLKATY